MWGFSLGTGVKGRLLYLSCMYSSSCGVFSSVVTNGNSASVLGGMAELPIVPFHPTLSVVYFIGWALLLSESLALLLVEIN